MVDASATIEADIAAPDEAPPAAPAADPAQAKDATIADLMSPPVGVFRGDATIAETVEMLREATKTAFITYCYVTDEAGKLGGVVVMREMLLAKPEDKLADVMLRDPFAFRQDMPLDLMIEILLGATDAVVNPAKLASLGLSPKDGYSAVVTLFLQGVLQR